MMNKIINIIVRWAWDFQISDEDYDFIKRVWTRLFSTVLAISTVINFALPEFDTIRIIEIIGLIGSVSGLGVYKAAEFGYNKV